MADASAIVAAAHTGRPPSAEVIRLVNAVRREHGLHHLRTAPRLNRSARAHAAEMVRRRYFGHNGWAGFITRTGYRLARWGGGENIAYGFTAAATVFEAWMHSPEHRENILRADFRAIGVGHVEDIWVQHFGGR